MFCRKGTVVKRGHLHRIIPLGTLEKIGRNISQAKAGLCWAQKTSEKKEEKALSN